jgi:hypothetical protein
LYKERNPFIAAPSENLRPAAPPENLRSPSGLYPASERAYSCCGLTPASKRLWALVDCLSILLTSCSTHSLVLSPCLPGRVTQSPSHPVKEASHPSRLLLSCPNPLIRPFLGSGPWSTCLHWSTCLQGRFGQLRSSIRARVFDKGLR